MTKVKPNKKKIIFIGFSNTEFIKFTVFLIIKLIG
jgi:hypothetical protein